MFELEKTLALIKPDACKAGDDKAIMQVHSSTAPTCNTDACIPPMP
jgi:hypothetical protein